jgi:hypothetical protein
MAEMRFQLGDKIYTAAEIDLLTVKDVLVFEKEAADLGRPMKWGQIEAWALELNGYYQTIADEKVSPAQRAEAERAVKDHEGVLWVIAMTIWASRRLAGEAVTFDQAIDFPMRDLRWLPSTQDRKAATNPTKARPRTTKASGRAAKPRAGAGQSRKT